MGRFNGDNASLFQKEEARQIWTMLGVCWRYHYKYVNCQKGILQLINYGIH